MTQNPSSNPLGYTGLDPVVNPQSISVNRAPNANDWQSFYPGDQWRDISATPPVWYILRSVAGNQASWDAFTSGGSSAPIDTLTGTTGGAVHGNPVTGNIDFTSSAGTLIIAGNASTNTLNFDLVGGSTAIDSLLPDSGTTPVVPTALGAVTMAGSGSITTVGGTNTLTTQLTGMTNHNLLIGAGTTTLTKLAPSATSGIPVISQGTSADPAYGVTVVAGGGTGNASTTAYAPILGGTTSIGAFQAATTGFSTVGNILTSTGASSIPTFQNPASVTGWQFLTNLSPSAGSAILNLSAYSATFNRYLMIGRNLFPTSSEDLYILTSLDGVTYETTQYFSGYNYWNYATATLTNVNATNKILLGSAHASGQGWGLSFQILIEINEVGGPSINGNYFYGSSVSSDTSSGTPQVKFDLNSLYYNPSAGNAVSALKVTSASGLVTFGSITLFGMKI